MALARVKTWIAGELLKAADLNGEFNNILNNPVSLISPSTGAINFNLQSHTNLIPAALSGTSGSTGQVLTISAAGTPVWGAVGTGAGAGAGSRVKGLTGTLTSQTGTFTADQYVLQTTNGANSFVLNSTASFAVSVGTAGPAAGGRDTAAVFASTYVHWYAITTGVGSTTPAGIVSTATPPTGPILPGGYTGWAYLGGSPYTSASTTVLGDHRFFDDAAYFYPVLNVVSTTNATTTETSVSVVSQVPPNAKEFTLSAYLLNITTTATTRNTIFLRTVTGANHAQLIIQNTAGSIGADSMMVRLPNFNQAFLYVTDTTANTPALNADLVGYKNPIGA